MSNDIKISIEEVLELVSFTRDSKGLLRVLNVLGSVIGDVDGSVWGDVGSVWGDVGTVWGDVGYVGGDVGDVGGDVGDVYGDVGYVRGNVYGSVYGSVAGKSK